MPAIQWTAKITSKEVAATGVATIGFDVYQDVVSFAKGFSTTGDSKEIIKDNIKEQLRIIKDRYKEMQGINIGDVITL